jgi:hypothetical protein
MNGPFSLQPACKMCEMRWRGRFLLRYVGIYLFFGGLSVVSAPVQLVRAWKAFHNGTLRGHPWSYYLAGAALNVAVAVLAIRYDRLRLRREGRTERGECLACGYSLTGNVTGVCPECGTHLSHAPQTYRGWWDSWLMCLAIAASL